MTAATSSISRPLSRRLDGLRPWTTPPVDCRPTAGYSGLDAGQGCSGALQPGGRLEPGQRPRRKNAREAGPNEGPIPHRSCEEQGSSHWRWSLRSDPAPGVAYYAPYTEWTFSGNTVRIPEFCAPALGNKPNVVTIDADIPANANGVLYKLVANSGGLTCFVEDGVLRYEYNLFIIQRTKIRAKQKLPRRELFERA